MRHIEQAEARFSEAGLRQHEKSHKRRQEENTRNESHVNLPEPPAPLVPVDDPHEMERDVNQNSDNNGKAYGDVEVRKCGVQREEGANGGITHRGEEQTRNEYDNDGGVEVEGVTCAARNGNEPAHGGEIGIFELRVEAEEEL